MPNGGSTPPRPVSSPTSPAPSLPPGQTRGRAGWNAALSEVRHRGPQPTAVADWTETDGEIAGIAGRIAPKQGGGLDRNHKRFEPRYANLTGHKPPDLVLWLCEHGVMPLYTPVGGSWLNMAESIERVLKRRALDGQHPHSPDEIGSWFEQTARNWNEQPTPFVWNGKRRQRR